jgi:hypothetical protein
MLDEIMFDRRLLKDADHQYDLKIEGGASIVEALAFRRGYIMGRLEVREEMMIAQASRRLGPPSDAQRHELSIVAWRDYQVVELCERLWTAKDYDELLHGPAMHVRP